MADNDDTINGEIQWMIDNSISQIPKPELVTIEKIYEDNTHVDCTNDNDDLLEYIPCIPRSNLKVGDDGILFVLSDDSYYIIA